MLNRLCRSLHAATYFPLTLILSSVAVVGCGGDKLSDDAYGFIDLAPYYYDGSSAANPSAGLPREINPFGGWMNGVRAQYYDFGIVGSVKKRTDTAVPDYAVVNPMYFFFNSAGQPLFSKPIYERRTGLWHMRGGVRVLDPNPPNSSAKNVPYSVRIRNELVDSARGTSDYQRPIVDVLQHVQPGYSGLWEIWEVIAPDDYQPDAIKSYATLRTALDSGWQLTRTQRVINCPVIDDRQYVAPTATWYGMPHPRIELWYRTKQGSCFLTDGWLALGDFNGTLYKANSNARRLNTFDVISYTIGNGPSARTTIVSPISRMFQPKVTVANQDPTRGATDIRYVGDNVTESLPKLNGGDPPGYRPIRWLWDLRVPQDPPYESGTYKALEQMDPAMLSARSGPFTKNIPLIGLWYGCKTNADCAGHPHGPGPELQCNQIPNSDLGLSDPPADKLLAANNNVAAAQLALLVSREGGPRCDVPAARFGEYCAPGIARCELDVKSTASTTYPEKDSITVAGAEVKYSASGLVGGYTCQPKGTGYCYMRCDSDVGAGSGKAIDIMVTYTGPDNRKKTEKSTLPIDVRCGNIPGYRCLTPTVTAGNLPVPTRERVCLRQCDTARPDTFNDEFCGASGNPLDPKIKTDVIINDRVAGDVQKGMTCSNRGISSVAACQWDPAYEPRDPKMAFIPR
jgi:hypothetical protein